jgi:hypothetical protein
MHALVRHANIAAGSTFTTADLYPPVLDALGLPQSQYSLASLRYFLSKLCAKGLLEKLPHSRRYRLAHKGYSICVLFRKLFQRIDAPLTAGLRKPFSGDRNLAEDKRCQLDRLYQRLTDDLDALLSAVGLKTAIMHLETRILFSHRDHPVNLIETRLAPILQKLDLDGAGSPKARLPLRCRGYLLVHIRQCELTQQERM